MNSEKVCCVKWKVGRSRVVLLIRSSCVLPHPSKQAAWWLERDRHDKTNFRWISNSKKRGKENPKSEKSDSLWNDFLSISFVSFLWFLSLLPKKKVLEVRPPVRNLRTKVLSLWQTRRISKLISIETFIFSFVDSLSRILLVWFFLFWYEYWNRSEMKRPFEVKLTCNSESKRFLNTPGANGKDVQREVQPSQPGLPLTAALNK